MPQEQGSESKVRLWGTESLRITTFMPLGDIVSDSEQWWEHVAGKEPEEVISRPGSGQIQRTGDIEGKKLTMLVAGRRVHWRMMSAESFQDDLLTELPTIGGFDVALGAFIQVARSWLSICSSLNRLAFGAILLRPVSSRALGYSELSSFLPQVEIDPENTSDFFYQINLPRDSTSGITDLRINRLTKWSVLRVRVLQVTAAPSVVEAQPALEAQKFASRLELDINTDAGFPGDIPRDKYDAVFDELVNLGTEIQSEGMIP